MELREENNDTPVVIEQMSPTPVEGFAQKPPEEQPQLVQPQVETPQADTQQVDTVINQPRDTNIPPPDLPMPEFVTPDEVITAGVSLPETQEPAAQPTFADRKGPLLLPNFVKDRTFETEEDRKKAVQEMGDIYWNGIFRTGDDARDTGREGVINSAYGFGIPKVDANGQPVVAPEGSATTYEYEKIGVFPDNINTLQERLTFLVEENESKSGKYHFFTPEHMETSPARIDTGYLSMRKEEQNPIAAFFSRIETESEGMKNYEDILRNAGIKNTQRLTYQMRQQAEFGQPFGAVEMPRHIAPLTDAGKFVGNVALETPKFYADITASVPLVAYDAVAGLRNNFVGDRSAKTDKIVGDVRDSLERQMDTDWLDPYQFDYAAEALAKEYGRPVEEAEAILTYSPDLMTTGTRLASETVAFAGAVLAGSRVVAMKTAKKLSDFLTNKAADLGDTPPANMAEAITVLESNGYNANKLIREFAEQEGGTGLYRRFLSDSIDFDIQTRAMLPGKFRESLLADTARKDTEKLRNVTRELDIARENNRGPEVIGPLEARQITLQKQIASYNNDIMISPKMKSFLGTELAVTTAYAVPYQLVYNYGSTGDDGLASLAGMAFALSTVFGAGGLSGKFEDAKIAMTSVGKTKDDRLAAARLRRYVMSAPPELQDQILAFASHRQQVIDELGNYRFPKGSPKEGQLVFSEDAFDTAFVRMSGLMSLQAMKKTALGETIDVQKDAGRLSEYLGEIDKILRKENNLHNESAELFDSLRFLKYDTEFDQTSEAGKMITGMLDMYDDMRIKLDNEMSAVDQIIEQRKTFFDSYMSGKLKPGEMADLLMGDDFLNRHITLELEHYKRVNLEPDATMQESAAVVDEYFKDLNKRMADAFTRHERYVYDSDESIQTSNQLFEDFARTSEKRGYEAGTQGFEAIRRNPEYANARIDMSEVFDEMVSYDIEGRMEIDELALINATSVGQEGTRASRTLNRMGFDPRVNRGFSNLFEESAEEYLESLDGNPILEDLDAIYAKAGVKEDDSAIDKYIAVRDVVNEMFEKGDIPRELEDQIKPKLGVNIEQFMHIISAMGRTAAEKTNKPGGRTAAMFREQLLDKGSNEFYKDFYSPARQQVTTFGDEYAEARKQYREKYIAPFRLMNTTISRMLRQPEETVDISRFAKFLDQMGLNRENMTMAQYREGMQKVLMELTGGQPLDVTTDTGKQIKALFTRYAQEEMQKMPGSLKFQQLLLDQTKDNRGGKLPPMIRPEKYYEIERALQGQGDVTPPTVRNRLEFLLRNQDGKYLFADVNGKPLVDEEQVMSGISYETGMGIDKRFLDAHLELERRITAESAEIKKRMGNIKTIEGNSISARRYLAEKFQESKGLGEGFYNEVLKVGGLGKIEQMKRDYVQMQVAKGVDAEVATEAFEQIKTQSTIDYLFNQTVALSGKRAYKDYNPETGELVSTIEDTSKIDANALLSMMGLRGDAVTKSRQEKVVRTLLGDEVFDHMRMIGRELFTVNSQGGINVTGVSMPLSAESLLSRGTSYFRGVISMRWLISEAAIRNARRANLELTKNMLFNPKVGKELLRMLKENDFEIKDEPEWVRVLITEFAKQHSAQQSIAGPDDEQEQQEDGTAAQMSTLLNNPVPMNAL